MVLRMGCERWLGPSGLERKLAPRAPSHFAQATSALRAPLRVMETWDFSALDSLGGADGLMSEGTDDDAPGGPDGPQQRAEAPLQRRKG